MAVAVVLATSTSARADVGIAPEMTLRVPAASGLEATPDAATAPPRRVPWSLERRELAASRAIWGGSVVFGVSLGALTGELLLLHVYDPGTCRGPFCDPAFERTVMRWIMAFTGFYVTAGTVTLALGARRRRIVRREREATLALGLGPASGHLTLTW